MSLRAHELKSSIALHHFRNVEQFMHALIINYMQNGKSSFEYLSAIPHGIEFLRLHVIVIEFIDQLATLWQVQSEWEHDYLHCRHLSEKSRIPAIQHAQRREMNALHSQARQ